MEFVLIILVAAGTFGLCRLVDKGFTKTFRGTAQHGSGQSVRLSKKYGSIGLILAVVGLASVFTGLKDSTALAVGGGVLILVGGALVVYYMTFGVFYDQETFLLTTFGKKSQVYRYEQIRCQQLYNSYGQIIIELQLTDGRAVQLQSGMSGVYPFMDTAFAGWCRQKGLEMEDCPFYDPENSCWFPRQED